MESAGSPGSVAQEVWDACEENDGKTGTQLAADLRERASTITVTKQKNSLIKAASTISMIVGNTKTAIFEGAQVGEAIQGEKGSQKLDVTGFIRSDGSIHASQLEDDKKHEDAHTRQAKRWNATNVKLDNNQTITRYKASEVGAMSAQQSIGWVCTEYRGMYAEVTSKVSAKKVQEYTEKGDLLGLAAEMNRKIRGITTTSQAPSQWTLTSSASLPARSPAREPAVSSSSPS